MPFPPGVLACAERRIFGTLTPMRILGIDPGLTVTGLGLIEADERGAPRALDWLTITTDSVLPLPIRLAELQKDLAAYLLEARADLAVVEKIFFAVNERTALDVAHARGVILASLAAAGLEVLEATPLQMKAAVTGDGSADKTQVQDMLVRLLQLSERPQPADAADALGLAVYGSIISDKAISLG